MATLTVASRANAALVLPAVLSAAYATRHGLQVSVVFEDVVSLDSGNSLKLVTADGDCIADEAILDFFHKAMNVSFSRKRVEVDEWLKRRASLVFDDYKALCKPMEELESHLTLRSYIVGYSLTLADIVIWGTLRGNPAIVGLRRNSLNITRWFSFIEDSNPWITGAVAGFQNHARQRKAAASAAGANYNIGLANTENGIVCRFPPEPSGYLHIGHAKAALLNSYFAHEYGPRRGTLICRFDDTNPSKESQEFQDSILYDLSLLGVVPDRISHSSDYFRQMYEACVKPIKAGRAYADNTVLEVMRDQRRRGIASACRTTSIDKSLAVFEAMKSGAEDGRQWCIRAKISVDGVNKALRDPVIYRCNHQPHHRTGTAWKVYPTYDFCAPFMDSIEQVTHALRTNEYRDRNAQYHWMQDALGLRRVEIWDFSRLNFVRTVLSKRKLTSIVESGAVWGWDDPRMPTVRGVRRRGCTISALRQFILKQGPSQNIVNMDWSRLWAINKKHIDPIAARYTAIPKAKAVTAWVDGIDANSSTEMPKHKNPELGMKKVVFSKEILLSQDDARLLKEHEVITLMNWGNATITKISTDSPTGDISILQLKLDLQSDVKNTEKKITWLAKEPANMVPVELHAFDYLITKEKLEKDEDVASCLTSPSETRTEAWADCNVMDLCEDDIIQFDRTGYFRVDRPWCNGQPAIMFNIPTGRDA
ncbi:glutamyl-tRNA synthetase [Aspergillus sclerotiicarbonarius CBS 121057]|uniref:glutamate--tRNA ligase n=1 Tax=Aspergillus sclerotiicarbonarius (strain CBS 121057 / IBT 28362) TaxID=1448318 RepID=A0A319EH31_ASPSB|nr:glutamyl-tRNA synthetase [Aspergillus sclerotiicarbonarius CBS 121057]